MTKRGSCSFPSSMRWCSPKPKTTVQVGQGGSVKEPAPSPAAPMTGILGSDPSWEPPMARFAFGKGKKKKRFWDIHQSGRPLRTHELGGVSELLPGYCTFASDSAARAELERLAGAQIAKGFTAADDEAREIAARVEQPKTPAAPITLPLRHDTYVYNEATGFMITSLDMAGASLDEGSKKWNKAVADGKMIPVSLFQDDQIGRA